jgi:tricarballylate dehydrogenase
LIAQQPAQIAFAITDSKAMGDFMPSLFPPVVASTVTELAHALQLDEAALTSTIAEYNAAIVPGRFTASELDDCATVGLNPPKTHWARAIDAPPFVAYPLRPGITFTYLGLRVDERARVTMQSGDVFENVFAAGEIMSGSVLGEGYLAGFGMTLGAVMGRIAGAEACRHARA